MADDSTLAAERLLNRLREIVGRRHVLTGAASKPFATGYRFGTGPIVAAVRPGTLIQMWRVAEACVAADRVIVMQAANTGLTGGSTPHGVYDRDVVVLSTSRLRGVFPIRNAEQVVCLPGSTLDDLDRLLSPLGREPHSVIGSSCIGASVVGGVCNNSGGALVSRGPAYTEYALFARVGSDGALRLCNHLGIDLGDNTEEILARLEGGQFTDQDVVDMDRRASAASDYATIVRAIDEPGPARFNADPTRLFEASGSAGKLIVFAVRLDTFAKPAGSSTFYIGTNDPAELTEVRRRVLRDSPTLPISGEYVHRQAFDLADVYGKDTVAAIAILGTERLPRLFSIKTWIDRLSGHLLGGRSISDSLLQAVGRMLPDHLPERVRSFRDLYEHHLIVRMGCDGTGFLHDLLEQVFPSSSGAYFECTHEEGERAMLHRFAVAGAAVRYRAVQPDEVEDIVALDFALPRNAEDWFERLPPEIESDLVAKLYYGHFFCHVLHQDYLVKKGVDPIALEQRLLELLQARGAEYPAEHNVGHHYLARPALSEHYRSLDPTNQLNPGIGRTSRKKDWL